MKVNQSIHIGMVTFVSDLGKVSGFLHVLFVTSSIKLIVTEILLWMLL